MQSLPREFPFRDILIRFSREYQRSESYWYIPKARALTDTNIEAVQALTRTIGIEFAHSDWNPEVQDEILNRGRSLGVLAPYIEGGTLQHRTALVRIWKVLLELLGLVWIRDGRRPMLTEAGARLLVADAGARELLAAQIVRYQYPNPGLHTPYSRQFKGLLPHLFLLQVMQRVEYKLSVQEYNLFVNLAKSHTDLERIVRYVRTWRDLDNKEQALFLGFLTRRAPRRHRRVAQNSSYQRAFLLFPDYVAELPNEFYGLVVEDRGQVDSLVRQFEANLKVTPFTSPEEWFAYYGNPDEYPSWYTYVKSEVEKAATQKRAQTLTRTNRQRLTRSQFEEVQRLEIEKGIEEFYVRRLSLLEHGLRLAPHGRQYATPIGRIDLLCKASNGDHVIVEIKATGANDAVFGQILRYIGWVHRNLGERGVRGIVLASEFPETARYSRIGLLRDDAERFIQFKRHGLNVANS